MLNDQQRNERMSLYQQGLSDGEIASAQGCDRGSIYGWRRRNGLPANHAATRIAPDVEQERRALHQAGATDVEIAKRQGVRQETVAAWRKVHGLDRAPPPNRNPGLAIVTPDMKRRCFGLLSRGMSARCVAKELNVCLRVVARWRAALSNPPITRRTAKLKPRRAGPAITPMSNPIYARIANAIGRGVAADVADDAMPFPR